MNKPIGGFFELENSGTGSAEFHQTTFLNTGRACLKWLLQKIRPTKVLVPYYTCNTLINPIAELNIPFEFFSISETLDPLLPDSIKKNELIIYINYFGLKDQATSQLLSSFPTQIIVDNTQSFFTKDLKGVFSFNSARKFFGVPDGAYCYGSKEDVSAFPENESISLLHLEHRKESQQELAYEEFLQYEASLNCEVKQGSGFSKKILSSIDYNHVSVRRRSNFQLYEEMLSQFNTLKLPLPQNAIPFCYPFLPEKILDKDQLAKEKIFIPTLWKEVLNRSSGYEIEKNFVKRLLPLPLDHRYDEKDVTFVASQILNLLRA